MIRYLLYYFICSTLLFSKDIQKFIYKTKFKSFNVGTTEITIKTNESDKQQTIITIESFSNKWIDLFYKLRHHSTLIVNSYDYSYWQQHKKCSKETILILIMLQLIMMKKEFIIKI